jgi:hypothetical protein
MPAHAPLENRASTAARDRRVQTITLTIEFCYASMLNSPVPPISGAGAFFSKRRRAFWDWI